MITLPKIVEGVNEMRDKAIALLRFQELNVLVAKRQVLQASRDKVESKLTERKTRLQELNEGKWFPSTAGAMRDKSPDEVIANSAKKLEEEIEELTEKLDQHEDDLDKNAIKMHRTATGSGFKAKRDTITERAMELVGQSQVELTLKDVEDGADAEIGNEEDEESDDSGEEEVE